jgi:hypothetical protein
MSTAHPHDLDLFNDAAGGDEPTNDHDAAGVASPPRRIARAEKTKPAGVELGPLGIMPERARWYGVERRTDLGQWEPLTGPSDDGSMVVKEWDVSGISLEALRRWGPGTFRVVWWGTTAEGSRRYLSRSREVAWKAETPPAAPVPIVAASGAPGGAMGEAFALLDAIDRRAGNQLVAMTQLANLARGDGGAGHMQVFAEMMRMQGEQTRAMIEAMREDSRAQLAAIRELVAGGDEDDGAPLPAPKEGGPFKAPRGAGTFDQVKALAMNYVAQNPAVIPQLISSLSAMAQAATPAPPPAPVAPPRRLEPAPAPRPAPSVAPPSVPGINGAAAEGPPPPPPASPSGFQS